MSILIEPGACQVSLSKEIFAWAKIRVLIATSESQDYFYSYWTEF